MKNNVLKRILVLFVMVSLLLVDAVAFDSNLTGRMFLNVYAEEENVAEVIDASGNSSYVSTFEDALLNENVTIKLLADITLNKKTEFQKNTTIIFNGYKISRNGNSISSNGLTMEVSTFTELKFANALSNHNDLADGSKTTIKLLNDVVIEENFAVNQDMSLTLDLNNYVFDGNQKSIINSGTLEIIDSSSNDNVHYWVENAQGLWKIQDSKPVDQEYYTTVGSCITNLVSEDRNDYWNPKFGALCNQGTLIINNVDLIGNIGGMGGALYNYGGKIANIINCNIMGNVATIAGGIANKGTLTIQNSKINSNVAIDEVGGIYNDHILTIENSEIVNNVSYGSDTLYEVINESPTNNKYPSAGIYSFFSDEEEEKIKTNNEYVRTSVTLKGKVIVTDNKSFIGREGFVDANFIVACNIDVDVKELTSESKIGITKLTATEPGVVGGDIPILGTVVTSCDESELDYFYADDDNNIVYYNNGTIELAKAASVKFVFGGGNEIESKKVRLNTLVEAPTAPTKDGYTFVGWYKDESLTSEWDFSEDVVTTDTTLYAKWTENEIDNPVIQDESKEEDLSLGLIILIIVSSIFGLLLIYFVIYLFIYKKKELNNKFFKAIYSWIDKVLENKNTTK